MEFSLANGGKKGSPQNTAEWDNETAAASAVDATSSLNRKLLN